MLVEPQCDKPIFTKSHKDVRSLMSIKNIILQGYLGGSVGEASNFG